MASIYSNYKEGKIVSFKFKVSLGRDENGKQIVKCTTWKPERNIKESKLKSLVEKEYFIWEHLTIEKFKAKQNKILPANITLEKITQNTT